MLQIEKVSGLQQNFMEKRMTIMDMLIIVLGLLMLLVLTLKKVPVSLAALISVVTIIIFSNMPVLGV